MLDIKRVLKAAPTKMRSREPLQQLWTPWGERIDHEWLSARAGNKAFNPAEEGERTLDEGRAPILGEHPRPTMVRDNCTMLNGWWDYAIASIPEDETAPKWRKTAAMLTRDEAVRAVKETAIPQTFDGKILVPFSPESALSGVHQTIYPDNLLWYRTIVHPVTLGGEETVRQIGDANRLILHFEAVDYVCACYVNGQLAGTHVGGYLPFDVDISAFIDPDDAFEIVLCVYDPNDSGTQLRGKQKIEREGIWYTAQSGIWQSVWLEIVPEAYLRTLTLKGASDGKLFVRAGETLPERVQILRHCSQTDEVLIGNQHRIIANATKIFLRHGNHLQKNSVPARSEKQSVELSNGSLLSHGESARSSPACKPWAD